MQNPRRIREWWYYVPVVGALILLYELFTNGLINKHGFAWLIGWVIINELESKIISLILDFKD